MTYVCFIPVCEFEAEHEGQQGRDELDEHMRRHSEALAEGRRIAAEAERKREEP